jgi:subtilisin family serine protease
MFGQRDRGSRNALAPWFLAALVPLVCGVAPRGADAQSLLPSPADTRGSLPPAAANKLDAVLSGLYAARQSSTTGGPLVAARPGTNDYVSVTIRGDASARALASAGALVLTRAGHITTAYVAIDALPGLAATAGVESIEAPHQLQKYLNVSCPDIQAADVWAGSPPNYTGLTGKNVVVGIIDTGLDITQNDFRTSTNHTRVKYIWDQMGVGAPPPSGFNYGAEWNASQLDANPALTTDTDGHGTHVTGIAAGNGRATGNSCPAYRYVGVAPEADLVIVRSVLSDNAIIDGANYVYQRATTLGEPAVILIAAGNQLGGHDGTSSLDEALSALTGPGRLLVAPVGNDGQTAIHSKIDLPANGSGSLTFTIPTYSPSTGEYLDMQSWHQPGAQFQVRLTTPSGLQSAWIQPGGQTGTVASADGAYYVNNDVTTATNGTKEIEVYTWWLGGTNPKPKTGTWTLDVQRVSGASSGLLHAWIAGWRFGSGNVSPAFSTNIDYTTQVASPATADSAIAVSAYTTRNTWTNVLGQTSFYTDSPPLQSFYAPANAGPRADGVQRPDLAAPGQGVVSALSAPIANTLGNVKVDDGVHWINRGTSMAAAHVAGALALLLQQTPTLTPSAARLAIRERVRTDSNTGSVPNAQWGYGKLDLAVAPTGVGGHMPVGHFAMAEAYPNPTRAGTSFSFTLSSADVSSGAPVVLRILDVRGAEVARITGSVEPGEQRLTWNGLNRHGYVVPAGVYLGQLEVGTHTAERKFVKLP